jgi:hypothetical protein
MNSFSSAWHTFLTHTIKNFQDWLIILENISCFQYPRNALISTFPQTALNGDNAAQPADLPSVRWLNRHFGFCRATNKTRSFNTLAKYREFFLHASRKSFTPNSNTLEVYLRSRMSNVVFIGDAWPTPHDTKLQTSTEHYRSQKFKQKAICFSRQRYPSART